MEYFWVYHNIIIIQSTIMSFLRLYIACGATLNMLRQPYPLVTIFFTIIRFLSNKLSYYLISDCTTSQFQIQVLSCELWDSHLTNFHNNMQAFRISGFTKTKYCECCFSIFFANQFVRKKVYRSSRLRIGKPIFSDELISIRSLQTVIYQHYIGICADKNI